MRSFGLQLLQVRQSTCFGVWRPGETAFSTELSVAQSNYLEVNLAPMQGISHLQHSMLSRSAIVTSAPARFNDNLFLVGGIAYFVLFGGAAMWALRAHLEFARLYKAKRDPSLPSMEELNRLYSEDPLAQQLKLVGLSFRLFNILSEPQDDPELERARRRVQHRIAIAIVVMFFGLVIPMVLGNIEG